MNLKVIELFAGLGSQTQALKKHKRGTRGCRNQRDRQVRA
jgi:hypothetical protein